ncbi:MAG: RNA-binding S4 domain-containing protein [Muribaculaceae bacterium]|nr:RNA-binding S4 domain-containing protein [Muribaculaceae bacterium]
MDSINNGSQQPEGGAEKKPKRPRISHVPSSAADSTAEGGAPRYERINYNRQHDSDAESGAQRPYQPRQYQPRPYGQNRPQGGYNRQGGYNNYNRQQPDGAGYQPRNYHNPETPGEGVADGENGREQYQGGYQPRQYQPRPYGQNRPQGGYNNRQGGYNNQNRQGGYNNRQGGYNNQNRQGGYNNRQGGYNNQNRKPYNNHQQQNGMPNRGKSFVPRPKRIEYEMPIPDPNEQIRLNKFMSNAGICSRREADEFIQQGLVKVNGQVVTELGTKITHSDVVEYDEKVVALESKCYILLNKPKDCVTTSDDPNGRTTVMDLVKGACTERIYPVGRLDRNTTGVLLLTNDGDLASKLTHPKYIKKKIYHVWTDKDISEEDMQRIADGIELEDGPIHADEISYATETDRNQAGIAIHSGRNRIVRRIFEALGYHVTKLDRVYFAGLTKKNLPRGRWRYLTQEEVNYLKMGSFE